MKKSTKSFLLGISSGIAFIVSLYMLIHCENDDTMMAVYGITMLYTMGFAMFGIAAGIEALSKEKPEWFDWLKSYRRRIQSSDSNSSTGSTIWMWLIGLPLLTLAKLIVREPGNKKRSSKW